MFVPTMEAYMDLTPTEFEKYSLEVLKEQTKDLKNIVVEHDKLMETNDGNYQIDGYIEFEVMGVKYKTLVECKHYKRPIGRDKVQLLFDKIRATGTHKGILISTSNFQSGAIKFASEHGIALIQLTNAMMEYEVRANLNVIMNSARDHYNFSKPYISVLQQSPESGRITCAYLTAHNKELGDFLLLKNQVGNMHE